MKIIFLVGFMGAGKTTLGKKLAKALDYSFIDIDKEIAKKEGITISEIFEKEGENYFRLCEKNAIEQLNTKQPSIVATGGGLPCHNEMMGYLNTVGTTIYLSVKRDTIFLRLKEGKKKRPLIVNMGDTELKQFIQDKLLEREEIYKQSSIILDESQHKIEYIIHLLQKSQ